MARSAEASMVVPLLHQCEDVHLEGVVVGGHPAEHVLELLVLFVQAPNLGFGQCQPGFTLPTVKRFSPTSGIGKPAVNRRKPLETARNDNSNSKTGNRCLPTGNRCLPTGNRRF